MSNSRGLSFVSEADLEEKRQKKQEEWEKVRKPDEPQECPEEEPFDGRTLYERLQEQKDKKQEEWEEQHKFKNMIRGLDSGETDFLDLVSKQQAAVDKCRYDAECKEISEFRSAVSQLNSSTVEAKPLSKSVQQTVKKSQLALIAGAIKRKSSNSNEETITKKSKLENNETVSISSRTQESKTETEADIGTEMLIGIREQAIQQHSREKLETTGTHQSSVEVITEESVIGTELPGVGAYSDSSDSNSSSSDSEIEIPHTVPRIYSGGRMPYI